MNIEDRQFFDCQKAIQYEKDGAIKAAIRIYEKLVAESWEGSHAYDRLCIFYRKNHDYQSEKRIILKAISVYTNIVTPNYSDRVEKYKNRLERLELKNSKKR